jgi:hydrophobe/amphiphile efflux-1 (HAE1) family protein
VSLAAVSIRNPVFAWMLMLGFIVFGAISFSRLPVGQYPDVDTPKLNVSANLEGASPEIMESDVVDALEDAIMAVEGIRDLKSTCKLGQATLEIEFDISRNIDVALQDVQARIAQAGRQLPKDLEPPIIRKLNPEEDPIMWVALSGTRSQQVISEYAKNVLRDQFLTVDGNGDVTMGGYLERNLRIWLKADALLQHGLSATDVIGAIQREHSESPAGRMEGSTRESNVQVLGQAIDTESMRNLLIVNRAGSPVYLKDVALVEDGFEDRRRVARSNGVPAQGLGIIKQRGANTVEVAKAVKARVAKLKENLPEGLELNIRVDNSQFIKNAIHEIQTTLILAVLLTALVCWFFLGSLSPTFNVLLAIPVSIFGTFAVMHFAGFSLNTFSLLALSLSVGIVVDDAVMVLENIYRHAEMGKDKVTAAREGAEQISFAALAATMAIIAIFLPVAFMTGIIGMFFFQFGVVLSVAVAISLLEAMTLAPSRCAQFLRVGHRSNIIERAAGSLFDGLSRFYRWVLTRILTFRTRWIPAGSLAVLTISIASFAGSLYVARAIPTEMVPAQDQGFYMVRITAPVGSTLEYTDNVLKKIEQVLAGHDEIEGTLVIAGTGDVNSGLVFITLKPRKERGMSQQQAIEILRGELKPELFPGTRVELTDPSVSGFGQGRNSKPIDFSIRGPDWETLGELSEKFIEEMKASGYFSDASSDYRMGMPEVQVRPNREKTLAHNVDMKAVTDTVSALIGGSKVAKYKDQGRRYDVRVRLLQQDRARPEDISNLTVRSRDGKLVRLSEITDVVTVPSLQSITRMNRQRAVTVTANPAKGYAQGQAIEKVPEIAARILPTGYTYYFGGASKAYLESGNTLLFAMGLGLVVAYMVLASQFNSFLHPVTVLMALPFSVSGALLALSLTGQSLNVYSMIGLILLMGIVKKNSILLVDYTNQLRTEGKPCDAALMEACPVRLRAIMMTTVATIAGAIPGAVFSGPGSELYKPMAISIIGGLTLSTLLTLIVVPCFYSVMDEVKTRLSALLFKSKPVNVKPDANGHAAPGKRNEARDHAVSPPY